MALNRLIGGLRAFAAHRVQYPVVLEWHVEYSVSVYALHGPGWVRTTTRTAGGPGRYFGPCQKPGL